MASRADFYVKVALFSRSSLKCFAARTGDGHLFICWMNLWFHLLLVPLPIGQQQGAPCKQVMIGVERVHRQVQRDFVGEVNAPTAKTSWLTVNKAHV
jgi:hypothetical protein